MSKKIDLTNINENDVRNKDYGLGAEAMQGKNAFGADISTGGVISLYSSDLTRGYKNY